MNDKDLCAVVAEYQEHFRFVVDTLQPFNPNVEFKRIVNSKGYLGLLPDYVISYGSEFWSYATSDLRDGLMEYRRSRGLTHELWIEEMREGFKLSDTKYKRPQGK